MAMKKSVEKILQGNRYRLISDDDGHWYVIKASEVNAFNEWVNAMNECEEIPDVDFEPDRLSGSPSNVTFLDPQRD